MEQRLQNIKNTWLALKQQDPNLSKPGAQAHKYHVDTENITRESIENFEKNYEFELPEEYKEYLIQVSNGGVSPYAAMYPLHDALFPLGDYLQQHPNHFHGEFPITEEQVIAYLTHKINYPTYEAPWIHIDRDTPGYLFLCEGEYGEYYIMPVNGVSKAEVWILKAGTRTLENGTEQNCFWIAPEITWNEDQLNIPSFLDWVENAQREWFNTNKPLTKRLGAIRTTWHKLKAHDPNKAVFGAFMHHYDFSRKLTANDLSNYESQYNIKLPTEYREYLLHVSDGGVGPFYGMYPLSDAVIALNSGSLDDGTFYEHLKNNPDHLAKPFPIGDVQVNAYLTKKINKEPIHPFEIDKKAGGYIFLAEYGCGGYYVMPVNGNSAGEVWYLQKQDANKLTYVMTDADGNETMSGSYGYDEPEKETYLLTPELKFNDAQASTVDFLEWIEHKQSTWFAEFQNNEESVEVATGSGENSSTDLQNETAFYPLAVGNTWIYSLQPEGTYTSSIISQTAPDTFIFTSGYGEAVMQKKGNEYLTDGYEKGNMQVTLRDDLTLGDTWDIHFKANNFDNILVMTVKQFGTSLQVGERTFNDVLMVEAESKMMLNGSVIPLNFFTQYYYAKGVGLILTTSTGGGNVPLISYDLK